MRWKAIYIILGLAVILGVVGYFFSGLIIKWSVERSLETVIGAKVDAQKVSLDLFQLKATIGNLQVANPRNPWKNLFEARNISFRIEPGPFFEGKTVIDEIIVDDLILGTPRKTSGKLDRPLLPGPLGEAQAQLNKDIADIPILNFDQMSSGLDTKKLLDNYKFQIDVSALDVRSKIETAKTQWTENLKDLDQVKVKIADTKKKLDEFQALNAKNPADLKKKIALLKEVKQSLDDLKAQIDKAQNGFKTEFTGLADDVSNLKKIADGDYSSLIKMAKLPSVGGINITESLLGKSLLNESTLVVNLVDKLQKMMPIRIVNPPKEDHPRGGQDITFPGRETYPRFLIKHIAVTGRGTGGTKFSGYTARATVDGVTDEQPLYGKPMLITAFAKSPGSAYIDFNGRINHISSHFQDEMHMKLGGVQLPDVHLSDSRYLPTRLASGEAEVVSNLTVQPQWFNLDVHVEAKNMTGDFSGKPVPHDVATQIIREVLSRIDLLTVDYHLEGFGKKMKMNVSSNLEQVITERLKAAISGKIKKYLDEIRAKVEERLKGKQQELEDARTRYQADLQAKIDQARAQLDEQKQKLDEQKQALEKQLKEKTNGLDLKNLKNLKDLKDLNLNP